MEENPAKAPETSESEALAALIIDALVTANIVARMDVARATAIATEEIEVRRIMITYKQELTCSISGRDSTW